MISKHIQAAIDRKPVYANHHPHSKGNAPELKPGIISALEVRRGNEKQDSSRSLVRITCYRTRRHDPDNSVYKFHIDALRAAGVIKDDTEDDIKLETSQIRVKTKAEERVVIEVLPVSSE